MSDKYELFFMGAVLATMFTVSSVVGIASYNHVTESTAKIERLERAGKNSSKYLIFTDKGTYEITDSWLMWRWNSSDLYGSLKEDNCYDFKLRGWRVSFFSMYPNIDTATKKECVE